MQQQPAIGHFQYLFLCAVQTLGKEAYGLKIREWLERELEHDVNVGQVYLAGKRLVQRKLLGSQTVRLHSGKRAVIQYALTKPGEKELEARAAFYDRLVSTSSDG